jgi:hypothetical protein
MLLMTRKMKEMAERYVVEGSESGGSEKAAD